MGANPNTTDLLEECMADTLLQAIKEKPFSGNTVNEIADTAGGKRSSCFRSFEAKDETLIFKPVHLWNQWADEHGMTERRRNTIDYAQTFFAFQDYLRDILAEIDQAELQSRVYDTFCQTMKPQYGMVAAVRFYSYGLFGLPDEWIKRGFCETPRCAGE